MKTQGVEPRFSQNLAPVGAKQNPKTPDRGTSELENLPTKASGFSR